MTTSMVGLKTDTYAKIFPKVLNPKDLAGNAEEEEEVVCAFDSVMNWPFSHNQEQYYVWGADSVTFAEKRTVTTAGV